MAFETESSRLAHRRGQEIPPPVDTSVDTTEIAYLIRDMMGALRNNKKRRLRAANGVFHGVPWRGLEPPRPFGHSILNAARLPVPPPGPVSMRIAIVVIPNHRRKFRPGLARRLHLVLTHPNPETENIVGAGAVETTQERLRPICDVPGPRSRLHLLNH